MALRISSLTREYVKVPVTVTKNGNAADPTGDTVQIAFTRLNIEPGTGDWNSASWETAGPTYLARCVVGPGGTIVLAKGTYDIWVKITDNPEIPVRKAGQLEVV